MSESAEIERLRTINAAQLKALVEIFHRSRALQNRDTVIRSMREVAEKAIAVTEEMK